MLLLLSAALMVADARYDALKPVRSQLGMLLSPLYQVAQWPVRGWEQLHQVTASRTELMEENQRLRAEALLIRQKLQKLASLTEQNVRLRELLNSSTLVEERVLVAELVGVDPNPFTQRILINKGERDGLFPGQPVLDATGLMGQVVEVMPFSARVLLITDASHSLPVQINRNGLRAIASGTGNNDWLDLRHVSDTADVEVGDLVVSSGLGQRFPAGYPVGQVVAVERDPIQPFAQIRVQPSAQLNRSRYLLLVFSEGSGFGEQVPLLLEQLQGEESGLSPVTPDSEQPQATVAQEDREQGDAQ